MSPSEPPFTPEQIAALPPEFQAILEGVIEHFETRIGQLQAELAAVKKTPRNSSLPPRTDHPHAKPMPQRHKSGKKPSGKRGMLSPSER